VTIPLWTLPQRCTVEHFDDDGSDPMGNPTRTKTGQDSYRCRLDQTGSTEVVDARDTTTTDLLLMLPAGAKITAGDEVIVGTTRYRVNGAPARLWAFRGEHHVEAKLRYVEEVS
jgi:hypothetical protein